MDACFCVFSGSVFRAGMGGSLDMVRAILKEEGMKGLFAGMSTMSIVCAVGCRRNREAFVREGMNINIGMLGGGGGWMKLIY